MASSIFAAYLDQEQQQLGSYLAAFALVLASACVYFHIKAFSYWSSRNIRGPRPWPLFGTDIYYMLGNKLELDLKWRREYGKTYGLYEGYTPLLRTTDNELIKQIFVKRFSSFTDRHHAFVYGKVMRNWLFWSEGERWANQRALVSPMFTSSRIRNMLGAMTECVDRFIEHVQTQLRDKVGAGGGGGSLASVDKADVANLTLDVIATTFFGLKLDTHSEASKQNEFLASALDFSRLSVVRTFTWLMTPRLLARLSAFDLVPYESWKYFDWLTKRTINERRRNGQVATPSTSASNKDFVQLFLEAQLPVLGSDGKYEQVFSKDDDKEAHYNDECMHDQLEKVQREQIQNAKLFKKFSDLEIRGQMTFMFLAGFETTATTISMSVFELAHQPESQERLYNELKVTFGTDFSLLESVKNGKKKQTEDFYSKLINCQQLDAFVSETLRLYSPILDHSRRANEQVELTLEDGRTLQLPEGMPISVSGFVLQRDPTLFERPDDFVLERFLPENRDKIKTCSFIPFGVGPRHCAGMRFALLEVKLALAKILANYTIAPGDRARAYPPKFEQNPIFLILEHSDFQLMPRQRDSD